MFAYVRVLLSFFNSQIRFHTFNPLFNRPFWDVFNGIRRGELIKLNLGDVDFQNELIRVHGKGKRERLIPISKRALEWLVLYIGKIRPMFAFIGSGNSLFLNNNGKRYKLGKLSDMASQ